MNDVRKTLVAGLEKIAEEPAAPGLMDRAEGYLGDAEKATGINRYGMAGGAGAAGAAGLLGYLTSDDENVTRNTLLPALLAGGLGVAGGNEYGKSQNRLSEIERLQAAANKAGNPQFSADKSDDGGYLGLARDTISNAGSAAADFISNLVGKAKPIIKGMQNTPDNEVDV